MCFILGKAHSFDQTSAPRLQNRLEPNSEETSMAVDDAWDSVNAPIWVPEVRVAAQDWDVPGSTLARDIFDR